MPSLYYRNAQILRAKSADAKAPCFRCGGDIDYRLRGRTALAFSAGHILAKSLGGSDDLSNLRPEHYGCNARHGNGVTRGIGTRDPYRRTVGRTERPRHSETWP